MSGEPPLLGTVLSLTRAVSTVTVILAAILLIIGITSVCIAVSFFAMVIAIIDFIVIINAHR